MGGTAVRRFPLVMDVTVYASHTVFPWYSEVVGSKHMLIEWDCFRTNRILHHIVKRVYWMIPAPLTTMPLNSIYGCNGTRINESNRYFLFCPMNNVMEQKMKVKKWCCVRVSLTSSRLSPYADDANCLTLPSPYKPGTFTSSTQQIPWRIIIPVTNYTLC